MPTLNYMLKRQIYLEFFQRCGFDINELPKESWKLFRHMNYRKFIEPMVIEDIADLRKREICNKYDITMRQLDRILSDARKRRATTSSRS